jgi:DNA-binding LytR/AlgR family response regulator
MKVMNCLIVEDEPLASKILEKYIEETPGLKLTDICENVPAAMEKLRSTPVEIIFLDIHLPKITGLEFIKTLSTKYHIILTTAYHQYALDGFNLNVVDYLLKPIEFSRFLQAVNKVFEKTNMQGVMIQEPKPERAFYFFMVDRKRVKVFADDIVYVESLKDYVRIHTSARQFVTKAQIGEMEKLLDEHLFRRIHKSFIINSSRVVSFDANEIEIGGTTLPIGRTYKEIVRTGLMRSR